MPAAAFTARAPFQVERFRKNHKPVFEVIIFAGFLRWFFFLLCHSSLFHQSYKNIKQN